MIAKGNFHGDGMKLAAYIVKGDPGERAFARAFQAWGQ